MKESTVAPSHVVRGANEILHHCADNYQGRSKQTAAWGEPEK